MVGQTEAHWTPVGYFPNAGKTWLVVKPEHKEEVISLFGETGIKITDDAPRLAVSVKKELYYKQRVQSIKEKSSDEVCRNLDIISQ